MTDFVGDSGGRSWLGSDIFLDNYGGGIYGVGWAGTLPGGATGSTPPVRFASAQQAKGYAKALRGFLDSGGTVSDFLYDPQGRGYDGTALPAIATSLGFHPLGATSTVPLPHPDASNQSIGPNLGGADAVTFPGESSASQQQSGGGGGLLLLLFGGLLIFILARKK